MLLVSYFIASRNMNSEAALASQLNLSDIIENKETVLFECVGYIFVFVLVFFQ